MEPENSTLRDDRLTLAVSRLEYLTPVGAGRVLDKSKSGIPSFSQEALKEAGLTPETWSLEVVADTASGSVIESPLTRVTNNALDWNGLMGLAEKHAIRFLHPCICTNVDDPFHVDLWEGVPLREIVWMAKPKAAIRRVYYQSYQPGNLQPFQASLPLGDVLETPPGHVPVVLAYKMNGSMIPAAQGGPVRVVVPGTFGNKSIKWLRRLVLTNDYRANDTDASEFNSDTDSAFKTKARFVSVPQEVAEGESVPLTGFVLVGISGISRVQYCVHDQEQPWPADDPYWTNADWQDATILPAPSDWGGGLPGGKIPADITQVDAPTGGALKWPMRFNIAHWAVLMPGLPAGSYDVCCRTIDKNGIAQPMPRPLTRTGANAIHKVTLTVRR